MLKFCEKTWLIRRFKMTIKNIMKVADNVKKSNQQSEYNTHSNYYALRRKSLFSTHKYKMFNNIAY